MRQFSGSKDAAFCKSAKAPLGLVFSLIGLCLLLGAVGGIVGYWFGYLQQSKAVFEQDIPDLRSTALRIENRSPELPEV